MRQFAFVTQQNFTVAQGISCRCNGMQPNKRLKPRRSLHYLAWIELGEGLSPLRCFFSDVSESGARLQVAEGIDVPETFGLRFVSNGAPERRCHVVWRTPTQIGLRFETPATVQHSLRRL